MTIDTLIAADDLAQLCKKLAMVICTEGRVNITVFETVAYGSSDQNMRALALFLRDEISLGNSLLEACKQKPD